MRRYPQIRTLSAIARELRSPSVAAECLVYTGNILKDGAPERAMRYVPARGEGFAWWWFRVKAAWLVFTGRADALTWPEDDGYWLTEGEYK